jgi:hypothetical protein
MKLVDKLGHEVKVGAELESFRGERATLVAIWEPGTSQGGNGGRVETVEQGGWRQCYFPSVYNLKFSNTWRTSSVER